MHVLADADTYLSILTSPAHLLAELTVELFTGLLLYPTGRWLLHRHDRNAHTAHTDKETS